MHPKYTSRVVACLLPKGGENKRKTSPNPSPPSTHPVVENSRAVGLPHFDFRKADSLYLRCSRASRKAGARARRLCCDAAIWRESRVVTSAPTAYSVTPNLRCVVVGAAHTAVYTYSLDRVFHMGREHTCNKYHERSAHTNTRSLSFCLAAYIFPVICSSFFFPESLEPLSTSSWRQHVLEFRGGRNQSHQPLVGIGPACAFALCVPALRSSLAVLRPPVRHPLSQGCRAGRNIFGARPPLLARRRRLQPARREIVAGRHCRDVTITGPSFVARASLWGSAQLGDWTCFVLFALR